MTKLDCNVVNCSYNADNCCRRTDIQVEVGTGQARRIVQIQTTAQEQKWM